MLNKIEQRPQHGDVEPVILSDGWSQRSLGLTSVLSIACISLCLHLNQEGGLVKSQTSRTSPGVRRLVSELCGHQGKVLPHLDPEVGLGDAAVVCVDGVDTGHLPGDQSGRKHTKWPLCTTHSVTSSCMENPPQEGFKTNHSLGQSWCNLCLVTVVDTKFMGFFGTCSSLL